MEDDLSGKAVIIDMGSGFTKVGFAGEKRPRAVFPTVIGTPRAAIDPKTVYIGDGALSENEALDLRHPVQFGSITNFDDFEKIIKHIYSTVLKVECEKQPLLLLEHWTISKTHREKIIQIMFETFDCSAFYVAKDVCMSVYSCGRVTGMVVDIGDDVTSISPILEGYVQSSAALELRLGGRDLTDYLAKLLDAAEPYFKSLHARLAIANYIKERFGYVALDIDLEQQTTSSTLRQADGLSGGKKINVAKEWFGCPEALFQPMLIGKGPHGLHTLIHQSILKCNKALQKDMWKNIVLSGGSAMFEGLGDRLQKELSKLAPAGTTVSVTVPPDCRYASWIGATYMADLPDFQERWITKQEYGDRGPPIVHLKCF